MFVPRIVVLAMVLTRPAYISRTCDEGTDPAAECWVMADSS